MLIQNFKKACRNIALFSIGFFLKIDASNDVVDIEGELFDVKRFGIFFINNILEQLFQILIFGEKTDGGQNCLHITVKTPLQPTQPYFHIPFFAQQFLGLPPPGLMGQKIVEASEGGSLLIVNLLAVEKLELRIHIVRKSTRNKGGIGPGSALYACGTHFSGRCCRYDGCADDHPMIRCDGQPDRRHGVAIPAAVGNNAGFHTRRVFKQVRANGQSRCLQGTS